MNTPDVRRCPRCQCPHAGLLLCPPCRRLAEAAVLRLDFPRGFTSEQQHLLARQVVRDYLEARR